jgi:hypothetical protein
MLPKKWLEIGIFFQRCLQKAGSVPITVSKLQQPLSSIVKMLYKNVGSCHLLEKERGLELTWCRRTPWLCPLSGSMGTKSSESPRSCSTADYAKKVTGAVHVLWGHFSLKIKKRRHVKWHKQDSASTRAGQPPSHGRWCVHKPSCRKSLR